MGYSDNHKVSPIPMKKKAKNLYNIVRKVYADYIAADGEIF